MEMFQEGGADFNHSCNIQLNRKYSYRLKRAHHSSPVRKQNNNLSAKNPKTERKRRLPLHAPVYCEVYCERMQHHLHGGMHLTWIRSPCGLLYVLFLLSCGAESLPLLLPPASLKFPASFLKPGDLGFPAGFPRADVLEGFFFVMVGLVTPVGFFPLNLAERRSVLFDFAPPPAGLAAPVFLAIETERGDG